MTSTPRFGPRIPGRRFLHSPGPTHLPDEVVHAMSRQPMDFGDPRVDRLVATVEDGLKRVLRTEHAEVFLYAGNGHGAWEATIANLLGPGRAVLIPGTGHFSDSWAAQAAAFGARVIRTPWLEGRPIDAAAVEVALREDREHAIVAVFTVHTDTASGTTSDLAAVRAAVDAAGHPALFVVDVVASLAVEPFAMDALRVDAAVGAVQKGLMSPPGVAFVAVGPAAYRVGEANPAPRFYWDWRLRRSELTYRKFCGTLPQNLTMGLEAALGLIFHEGLDAVIARHRRLAAAVHAAVDRWSAAGGVRCFTTAPEARAAGVTAIEVGAGIDPEALRTVARERYEVAIAGGLGPLAGRVFRIGHLGDINAPMVLGALAGVEAAMREAGVPHTGGGVEAAVAALGAADQAIG